MKNPYSWYEIVMLILAIPEAINSLKELIIFITNHIKKIEGEISLPTVMDN